jgi:hypothetical protein
VSNELSCRLLQKDRGRVLVTVAVEVIDEGGTVVLTAGVEWFIARSEGMS